MSKSKEMWEDHQQELRDSQYEYHMILHAQEKELLKADRIEKELRACVSLLGASCMAYLKNKNNGWNL